MSRVGPLFITSPICTHVYHHAPSPAIVKMHPTHPPSNTKQAAPHPTPHNFFPSPQLPLNKSTPSTSLTLLTSSLTFSLIFAANPTASSSSNSVLAPLPNIKYEFCFGLYFGVSR